MEGLIKCARCHSELLPEFYKINRKGNRNKCCIPCLSRFKCSHCPYRCSKNSHLQIHIKMVHDKLKDFKCNLCDYKCSMNNSLKRHIKQVHDKIKDFECSICDYKCSDNNSLKQHIKAVHNKIKDFECVICDYRCSDNSSLKKHIKQIHDKIKDFECSICDYKCSTKGDLKKHIKQVHDKIKDFECSICDYKCSDNNSLKQHIKQIHDKIKDFECSICHYKCSSNSDLTRHIKTCTGNLNCSSGELAVMNVLKSLNITYLYDTSYGNVKHKRLLKWDFVIETSGEPLFIEYDGKSHTLPIRYGGISQERAEENLTSSKIRDKIKDDYCNENGLLLLRIPYYEKENVFSLVSDFISENTL